MANTLADWSTDSNSAVHISLVAPSYEGDRKSVRVLHTFNPKMTYAIFGEEESIFGYTGLKINLKYSASDMRPALQILYTKKFKTLGDTEAMDLKACLEDFLPKKAFEKQSVFEAAVSDPALVDWTPPGELWQSFEVNDKTIEIWRGCLTDPAVVQMIKRIQILVPLFIEGGTLLDDLEDEKIAEKWTAFFMYQKKRVDSEPQVSPYTFMGYGTVFKFFPLHPKSILSKEERLVIRDTEIPQDVDYPLTNFPCRSRISQFLILPPFQGGGNGSRLYKSMFQFYYEDPQTFEITVEDPSEAFDDMRDINDLSFLRTKPDFVNHRINTTIPLRSFHDSLDWKSLEALRLTTKIAPRQFYRVLEMQLLSLIPTTIRQSLLLERPKKPVVDSKARIDEYRKWKLIVKSRLYRHNKQALIQLDKPERLEKLDQVLGTVEADYGRLLRAHEERNSKSTTETSSSTTAASGDESNEEHGPSDISLVIASGKRSSPDDETGVEGEPSTKKQKL